jgi:hypothetical protein
LFGLTLTHAYQFQNYQCAICKADMNSVRYITGWGLQDGWNDSTRELAVNIKDHVHIRTIAGDPSYHSQIYQWPIYKDIQRELTPWLRCLRGKPFWLEIGNEPNTHVLTDDAIWVYKWFLEESIKNIRNDIPTAKIISPAVIIGEEYRHQRFLEICQETMNKCDAIAVHMYEHDAFNTVEQRYGTTGQVQEAQRLYRQLFPNKPLIVSEYGINASEVTTRVKGQRYATFIRNHGFTNPVIGFFVYHFCEDKKIHPQYHFDSDAQLGFLQSTHM